MSRNANRVAFTSSSRPNGRQILEALNLLPPSELRIIRKTPPGKLTGTPYAEFPFDADLTVRINAFTGECYSGDDDYARVIARIERIRARCAINAKLPSFARIHFGRSQ